MIGYIKGNVLAFEDSTVLIETNGIGYEVTCSSSVYSKLISQGYGEVYTYMAVREDGVNLYGFESRKEKEVFLKLISVSGVGPKMGITILSNMSLSALCFSIATNDVKTLASVKGLGKKTAERIILELREKISADGAVLTETGKGVIEEPLSADDKDAVTALMSLGFTQGESSNAVKEAKAQGTVGLEKIIAYAIKHIK